MMITDVKLSKNFTLNEFLASQEATRSGISNEPNKEILEAIQALVVRVMQPIRDKVNKPISISSGYRSPEINRRIGGSLNSQHIKGEACDFMIAGMSALDGCKFILTSGIEFDQLINEGTWIHISFNEVKNKKQVLTAHFNRGKVSYTNGL